MTKKYILLFHFYTWFLMLNFFLVSLFFFSICWLLQEKYLKSFFLIFHLFWFYKWIRYKKNLVLNKYFSK